MRQTSLSLFKTYGSSLRLYAHTFIGVLPFLLLLALARFVADSYLPADPNLNPRLFYRILADSLVSSLMFTLMLQAIYHYYVIKKWNYRLVFKEGIKRFVNVFLANAIISLPLLLTLLAIWKLNLQWKVSLGLLSTILLFSIVIFTFSFIASVFIVINKENVISALKHSASWIKTYWGDTLLVVLLLGIISGFLSLLLQSMNMHFSAEIQCVLFGSFYPCVVMMHYEALKKAKQAHLLR